MKAQLVQLLTNAVAALQADGTLPADITPDIMIERTRDRAHGDFASNLALMLAKPARRKPRDIAEQIVSKLATDDAVVKVEIAGPGFINFFLGNAAWHAVVDDILVAAEHYGLSQHGEGKRIQVEFVSANPTGPLHVGHGRGAAYGAAVADLLTAIGYDVHREYYVNDAGRQMDILAASVYLRYLDLCGETVTFPANGYQGDYVWDIGATLHREHGDALRHPVDEVFRDVPADEPAGGDKEAHIDGLVQRIRDLLGDAQYRTVFDEGLNAILGNIRQDLKEFGVEYDEWFSERSLSDNHAVEAGIERLKSSGHVYEKNGALWFKSTDYGDEKDRVIVRDNGQTTYFASDIAYHANKLERGYDRVIDVWGADHHGYVSRLRAGMQALGHQPDELEIILGQLVTLKRGGEEVRIGKRSGTAIWLDELLDEVVAAMARMSTRPEPSRMAGVMASRDSSCSAMSHSHWPNTWV